MIKIFILDRLDVADAFRSQYKSCASKMALEVEIDFEEGLAKGKNISNGYDIYLLHSSLFQLELLTDLRKSNPNSYILMRNTILELSHLSQEITSSANCWSYGFIEYRHIEQSLKHKIKILEEKLI